MNRMPRPVQITGLFIAELRWPRILGGETEVLGPTSSLALRKQIKGLKAGLPGDAHPGVTITEIPRSALEDAGWL